MRAYRSFLLFCQDPFKEVIMVERQMITSLVFKSKCRLSVNMMRNLHTREGGVLISDSPERFGLSGEDPEVTTRQPLIQTKGPSRT